MGKDHDSDRNVSVVGETPKRGNLGVARGQSDNENVGSASRCV